MIAALGRLCRGTRGERVVHFLSRLAPTWLAQMPALVNGDHAEELRRRIAGATQARMLRELAEALEALGNDDLVILALDDLHWADPSTSELIALLGRRRDAAHFLLIGTYRPAELAKTHPLTKVLGELIAHKQAAELPLVRFSEETVAEYVNERFVGNAFPNELASTAYRMTDGNPLFVVTLFEDLEGRQMIRLFDGRWELTTTVEDVASRRPDSIKRLLDVQIDRLSVTEQRIIEAASVAGNTFAAGVVAYALDMSVDDVESCCESLANEYRFLRYLGTETWPDGTIQCRYGFVHALYQHAALARISSVRHWHRRIAERLEAGYPDNIDTIAPELAIHFDAGHVFDKAAQYYARAGERALRRHGSYEALAHFERARALIARLAQGRERDEFELRVLNGLGPCLFSTQALDAPELVAALTRAAELASHLARDADLCAALVGLQRCRLVKGELRQVSEHADEVARIASRSMSTSLGDVATRLSWSASLYRGHLLEAERGLRQLCSEIDARGGRPTEVVVWARADLSQLAWLSGRPDEALEWGGAAVSSAEADGDPFALGDALCILGFVNAWRRDAAGVLGHSQRLLDIANEHRFAVWQNAGRLLVHWANSQLEPTTSATHVDALLAEPWDLLVKHGWCTFFVELCMRAGREALALEKISEALHFTEQTDERAREPELHRLRGELLKSTDKHEAERCFMIAIELAGRQASKSFELRAVMSLCRLPRGVKQSKALEDLRQLFETFTEGFDTGDLRDAATLLAQ